MSSNQLPDPGRRQTRAKNANAHPGRILLDALPVRRKKEDIEAEKKGQRQVREEKKAKTRAAVLDIADFENQMAIDDRNDEMRFPRHHKTEAMGSKTTLKRKSQSTEESNSRGQRTADSVGPPLMTLDNEPQAKKSKAEPLRRTETYLRPEDCDEFPRAGGNGIQKLTKPDLAKFTNNKLSLPSKHIFEESEDEAQEFEAQESEAGEFEAGESEASDGSEEDDFETPKALRTKKMVSSGSDIAESVEEFSDVPVDTNAKQPIKSIKLDLAKVAKPTAQAGKEKRAFRKEVEARRTLVGKEKMLDGSASRRGPGIISQNTAHSPISLSTVPAGQPHDESTIFPKQAHGDKALESRSARAKPMSDNDAIGSRSSATTGNSVVVVHSDSVNPRTGLQSKPNSMAKTKDGAFSDEDDSAERAAILQSPPKGMQRLSSRAIVKIEQSSRSDDRKSRSKKQILDQDILAGWSRSIEPHFIYWFFYKLSPWPSSGVIESCAQKLWDWTFGDSYPLDLAKSPKHVQLLTQKLCDIRTQCAASAFICLEAEFQDQDAPEDSEEMITELRQQYAQDLYDDTKFIFGKYTVSDDGTVRKSQPYQGKIILRTVASAYKHIKDVKSDASAPLPTSRYPKTLLAIAAVVVERALKITIENKYNFETHKLIPQPDPIHPARKPSTSILAFSEAQWASRMEFHLEKCIPKLKEKDWEKITQGVAQFNGSTNSKPGPKSKGKGRDTLDEEPELSWESDSESEN